MFSVIIVDDEPLALESIRNIISWDEEGFTVIGQYTDPSIALEKIRESVPDAVFTDIRMSGLSGLELIRRVREEKIPVEFIIVSAFSDFNIAREAIQYQTFDYIVKPLDPEEVLKVVQRLAAVLHDKKAHFMSDSSVSRQDILNNWLRTAEGKHLKYLATADDPSFRWEIPDGILWIGSVMPDGRKYILLALDNRHERELSALRRKAMDLGIKIGISRARPSFDDLEDMFEDAVNSMIMDFDYSGNETAAAIQSYIARNYRSEISLADLSRRFFLSGTYLCEYFKKTTGQTLLSFITSIRMKQAVHLMKNTEMTLQDISLTVGYSNYGYFGRIFKRCFGVTPEKFRTMGTGSRSS